MFKGCIQILQKPEPFPFDESSSEDNSSSCNFYDDSFGYSNRSDSSDDIRD